MPAAGNLHIRFWGGAGANGHNVEIVWRRRDTGRQTETTNINLSYRQKPVFSTQTIPGRNFFVILLNRP
jgi:hypothetical protein